MPKPIFALNDQEQAALVEFLQDLVRTPSLSGQEDRVATRVAAAMRRVGFGRVFTDRIGNVVGLYHEEDSRPLLLYNAHMDTVGVSDESAWRRKPFSADVVDGVLYGRGACDMKGPLAAMLYAVKLLHKANVRLKGNLALACMVYEEPCEGLAMRVLVEEEGLKPDWVVLGEPTNLQISRGQRGRLEMQVTTHGRSCHAARPDLGENAIYAAARLIFSLEMLSEQLGHDPFLGSGTLAVTQVESCASSRNAIPDRASFIIDRRLTLGETEAKALAEVQQSILREGINAEVHVTEHQISSYTGYSCAQRECYPAWALDEHHPLVQTALRTIKNVLGYRPTIGQWGFSTDGVYTMGQAGIPTIGFGPGEEQYAHTAAEQIKLQDVFQAASVYAQLALNLLNL